MRWLQRGNTIKAATARHHLDLIIPFAWWTLQGSLLWNFEDLLIPYAATEDRRQIYQVSFHISSTMYSLLVHLNS